ncbi:fatty acyl-AMP ligase [Moorena sp. SIO3H5]|uniref:fatty acyl-AMP ligase n=1 Tax=Moorena sp. SIO3H5 TaxID=2607834 RepID=UPI0013BBBD3F|nr:fatty acyl-AMP ligase [Moorena sp. SIO3H5]NEO73793.1 fatty acyl-AMP ligase [Moorena sp. SIO3H5]
MTACLDYFLNTIPQFSNLVDLLGTRAENQPEQIAYIFLENGETESAQLNYQQLNRQAQAIAASLQSLVSPGERVLLLYPSGLEFIAAFFGCLYAGVVAVPAYQPRRNQKMSRLQAIVADAQATVALTTTSVLGNIEGKFTENPELADLHWVATDNIGGDRANEWQEPALTSNTLAFLQYTSGSTGTPKGVMVSHGNLLHNQQMIQQAFGHTADTIVVGWLPFYHDMGLIGNVLQPLYLGKPVILMPPVAFLQKPIRWLQAISRYKATTSGGPNFAYDLCVNKIKPEKLTGLDLSSWRVAFSGAEPVLPQTLEKFANYFAPCGFRAEAFYPCYGMAETTLLVSGGLKTAEPIIRLVDGAALSQNKVVQSTDHNDEVREIVGCGRSWLNQKIAIANPESQIQCPDGQVGEIWVSGASVAMGYWRKPQKTQETFHAYLADSQQGPFLRTGDLGFLLDGELFITGRIKDVIIIRGQNHYPQDIELTVQKSHPALRPHCGAAFTVEFKGDKRLVIVQEVERSYIRKLDVKEVAASICQGVTAEHALQVYAMVLVKTGSIPKTSSGKIRRQACRAEFLTGSLNVVGDWSLNPQGKVKFRDLQADVESLLQKVESCK